MIFKTCKEVQTFLKTGTSMTSVFIDSWEGAIQPPYIVVSEGETQVTPADNKAYAKERRFFVAVFTKKSDETTRETVEKLFDDNEIYYTHNAFWLNDLRLECHEYEI